jgi:electron transfer flavoprotein alpha subunit
MSRIVMLSRVTTALSQKTTTTTTSRWMTASALRLSQKQQQQQQQSNCRWASTLVVSEPLLVDGTTPPATLSTATAAQQLLGNGNTTTTVDLLVVGETPPTKIPAGISTVYHVPLSHRLSETVASAIETIVKTKDCKVVVGTSSKFGNTVIPRAAALLDVSPVTDILEIVGPSK